MAQRGFDFAPTSSDPTMICSLRDLRSARADLEAAAVATVLDPGQLLSPTTSLGDLRRALTRYDVAVVVDTLGGVGVVTHADLAHPAISSSVFHIVMLVEQGLNAFLELFDEPERLAEESLKAAALDRIRGLIAERERRNLELSFAKSMSLEDRFDLVAANAELWSQIASSKSTMTRWKRRTQKLRDELAHSGSLLDVPEDPRDALAFVEDLNGFAVKVWNRVVDPLWTRFAFAEILRSDGAVLAGRGALPHLGQARWVVTADNPGGIAHGSDPKLYRSEQDRLRVELENRRMRFDEGRAGRLDHWEHSFVLAGADRDDVLALGAEFGQLGVFELTDESQLTIRCLDGQEMRCVPRRR